MRLFCITLLFISIFGVNSVEIKRNIQEVKTQNDQDVKESGYYIDTVNKQEYGKYPNNYGYSRDVYNKYRGPTYTDLIGGKSKVYDGNDSKDKLEYGAGLDKPLDEETIKKLDEIYGFTGPTANDEPENLIRPCALDDWECIRKYFAANGHCKPAHGPIPDPFYMEKHTAFFSSLNITANVINFEFRGLSTAKINDFYVNKKSGNLVFAFDVQAFNISSPRVYFRYRRTAKESIVLADTARGLYRAATFTAVIPKVPKLRLDHADIHVDIDDGFPPYIFGPGLVNSTDPDVLTAVAQIVPTLPILVREGFMTLTPLIAGIYIQQNICKFDIDLISL